MVKRMFDILLGCVAVVVMTGILAFYAGFLTKLAFRFFTMGWVSVR